MVSDPIGDMIIQIKNAGLAGRQVITISYSKAKERVGFILEKEGYIQKIEKVGETPKSQLKITLRYIDGVHVIDGVKRKSKPGSRLYIDRHSIPIVMGGVGIAVVSTPKGIMTGKQANKEGVGGELMCEIW